MLLDPGDPGVRPQWPYRIILATEDLLLQCLGLPSPLSEGCQVAPECSVGICPAVPNPGGTGSLDCYRRVIWLLSGDGGYRAGCTTNMNRADLALTCSSYTCTAWGCNAEAPFVWAGKLHRLLREFGPLPVERERGR